MLGRALLLLACCVCGQHCLQCVSSKFHIGQGANLSVAVVECDGMCQRNAVFVPANTLIHFERSCVPVLMDTEIGCETNFAIQNIEPRTITCYCNTDLCNV